MEIITYPDRRQWSSIIERPRLDISQLNDTVSKVLNDVRLNGDEAVKAYEQKFDKVSLASLSVTEIEINDA